MLTSRPYCYEQTFNVIADGVARRVTVRVTFWATSLELRWLKVWAAEWTEPGFLFDDERRKGAAIEVDEEQRLVIDDTTIAELYPEDVAHMQDRDGCAKLLPPDNIIVFQGEFAGELGDEPTTVIEDFLPHFTVDEIEEMSQLWGWDEWCCPWRDSELLELMRSQVARRSWK